jgi:hypothetical protein
MGVRNPGAQEEIPDMARHLRHRGDGGACTRRGSHERQGKLRRPQFSRTGRDLAPASFSLGPRRAGRRGTSGCNDWFRFAVAIDETVFVSGGVVVVGLGVTPAGCGGEFGFNEQFKSTAAYKKWFSGGVDVIGLGDGDDWF